MIGDCAKEAHRIAVRECYDRTVRVPDMMFENSKRSAYANGPSPLFGSRIPAFFHDELLGEHPISMGHDGATRISEVMCDVLRWRCPDLAPAVAADPCLMPGWFKSAKTVRDASGRLVVWQPEEMAA